MECERFKQLLKTWYMQVQDEALAPARMVDFMEQHISECPTCIMDPDAKSDIAKIITLVLPKDKLKPATRSKKTVTDSPDLPGSPESVDDGPTDATDDSEKTDDDEDVDVFADDDSDEDIEPEISE